MAQGTGSSTRIISSATDEWHVCSLDSKTSKAAHSPHTMAHGGSAQSNSVLGDQKGFDKGWRFLTKRSLGARLLEIAHIVQSRPASRKLVVAFHSQLLLIFRIAHCNLYVYIQMHYTYPQFWPEDLGYHCSYFVC